MQNAASTRPSILCIEDDLDTCEFMAILLAEFRFEFTNTITGALPKLDERPHDLYILDNWLPDGRGIDLCRKIRDQYPTAPILFTSGSTKPSEIDEALQAGADRYVLKPCEPERLREIVKDLIFKN
jgi:DNA-binding response OmpR family regulator